jgi:hypothetical protein
VRYRPLLAADDVFVVLAVLGVDSGVALLAAADLADVDPGGPVGDRRVALGDPCDDRVRAVAAVGADAGEQQVPRLTERGASIVCCAISSRRCADVGGNSRPERNTASSAAVTCCAVRCARSS